MRTYERTAILEWLKVRLCVDERVFKNISIIEVLNFVTSAYRQAGNLSLC